MADSTRSDITLNGSQASWQLNLVGDVSGQTFIGNFTFRCFLSPLQAISSNREFRELLGQNPTAAPEHESFLAYSLTQLKYRVISAPPFWSSTLQDSGMAGNLPDENILASILDAAIASEVKYKNGVKERKLAALKIANLELEEIQKANSETV